MKKMITNGKFWKVIRNKKNFEKKPINGGNPEKIKIAKEKSKTDGWTNEERKNKDFCPSSNVKFSYGNWKDLTKSDKKFKDTSLFWSRIFVFIINDKKNKQPDKTYTKR